MKRSDLKNLIREVIEESSDKKFDKQRQALESAIFAWAASLGNPLDKNERWVMDIIDEIFNNITK